MDVTENSRETRRRVFRVVGVTAICGLVVISTTFLALRISSMMPSVIEAPKTIPPAPSALELPLPREGTAGESAEANSGSRRLAEVERPQPAVTAQPKATAVRSQPSQQQVPPVMSRAISDPLTEAERTRRTAAWLLRTYDRDTAEKYVRDAIAFYPVEDPDGVFWRQVLTSIAPRADR
jgi:hypothetical protein